MNIVYIIALNAFIWWGTFDTWDTSGKEKVCDKKGGVLAEVDGNKLCLQKPLTILQ